jgi:hypothetical protein
VQKFGLAIGIYSSICMVGTPDQCKLHAICSLPANIRYSFASGLYPKRNYGGCRVLVVVPSRYPVWFVENLVLFTVV